MEHFEQLGKNIYFMIFYQTFYIYWLDMFTSLFLQWGPIIYV